jgi:hypothetical protein
MSNETDAILGMFMFAVCIWMAWMCGQAIGLKAYVLAGCAAAVAIAAWLMGAWWWGMLA